MPELSEFEPGRRVATHPATDVWMQGDRYGVVERVGGRWIYVRLDSGRRVKMAPANVILVPRWHQIPKEHA